MSFAATFAHEEGKRPLPAVASLVAAAGGVLAFLGLTMLLADPDIGGERITGVLLGMAFMAVGATVVLYDGSPIPPAETGLLWRLASEEKLTHFGTSAKFLAMAEKLGHEPARTRNLESVEVIYSTGSPLAEHSYDWVASAISPDVRLSSISGGTDV